MRLESAIQTEILKKSKQYEVFAYKHPPDPVGIPDVHIFGNGIHLWVEVKRSSKDKPKPHQLLKHDELRKAGDTVIVAWTWEQVEPVMDRLFTKKQKRKRKIIK